MDRFSGGMHGFRGERTLLLNRNGLRRNYPLANSEQADLEFGDAVPAANVSYGRLLSLAKPKAGRLIVGTIALLIASTSSILIPRFGGTIIDIVSGHLQTHERKSEAVRAVNKTILGIFLIVIIGFALNVSPTAKTLISRIGTMRFLPPDPNCFWFTTFNILILQMH